MKYYKVKFKPYDEYLDLVDGWKKLTEKGLKFRIKPKSNYEIKMLICGLRDHDESIIYDILPKRIKDKELEDIEIVEFKDNICVVEKKE